jgi:hypothetical protein
MIMIATTKNPVPSPSGNGNHKIIVPHKGISRRTLMFVVIGVIAVLAGCYLWSHWGYTGYVVSSRYAARSRGHPTFLDLDSAYPNQKMTVVIWGSDRAKFTQPESFYLQKTIHVSGWITHYRDKPEIVITSPDQIQIQ